jgi:hypothetical protein
MGVLQHELQHVLEYATGELTALGYLSHPGDWTYEVELRPRLLWSDLGAEQRATLAERLWLAEHGLAPADEAPILRAIIPWARRTGRPPSEPERGRLARDPATKVSGRSGPWPSAARSPRHR